MAKRRPSGDGMVRKRDDGRWEGRIVIGHKENGDSIFHYVYAPTQKELSAKLRQHIDTYQGADLTELSRMTLSDWLDQWLENIADTLRPNTLKNYRSYIENHSRPGLGDTMTDFKPKQGRNRYWGSGYLGQTKSGRWNGRYTVTWPDGTKRTRDVYAATEDECEKLLAEMIVEMKTEVAAEKERLRAEGKAG